MFQMYFRSSVEQRLSLLQGLMDSDGYIDMYGRCEFVNVNERLADAVIELAAGLGLRPTKRKKRVTLNGIEQRARLPSEVHTRHQCLPPELAKRARIKRRDNAHVFRAIVDVRSCEPRPVRCIQVGSLSRPLPSRARGSFPPIIPASAGLGCSRTPPRGWIDPGFSGHVTLELSNVATLPIKLWPGMKIGQLCLFRTSSPAEHPYGSAVYGSRYQEQRGPTLPGPT